MNTCSNCGGSEDVQLLSFDLDLPAVQLCRLCSLTIVTNRELFDEMGQRGKRRSARRREDGPAETTTKGCAP